MNAETFCEHFATFAEAPNGVQKLREMILQLAVQGKLVPQDPSDEPAKILFDKIVSEKNALIAEKAIRKSNSHTSRNASTDDYDVPAGWAWVTLDDITEIGTGGTPPTGTKEYYENGTVPWCTSSATNSQFIDQPEQLITEKAVSDCRLKVYPCGSLVVALYGQGKTRGQVGQLMFDSTCNQACAVIRFFGEGIGVRDYIRLVFRKKYHELRDLAAGGAQPNLNVGMIRLMKIPLPPLAEQKRIVEKVDQLMGLCHELESRQAARREARSRLVGATLDRLVSCRSSAEFPKNVNRVRDQFDRLFDTPNTIPQLRQTILQLAVQGKLVPQDPNDEPATELKARLAVSTNAASPTRRGARSKSISEITFDEIPFDLPNGWVWVRFGELVPEVEYGTSHKASEVGGTVPVLRMNAIRDGKIILDESKFVAETIDELPRLYLKNGDILFNRTNSFELVGKTGAFRGPDDKFTFASYLIRGRLLPELSPDYVVLAMNSTFFRKTQIEPEITQQCGQANFNGTKLRNTLIPLPPLAEQMRIVEKVDQLLGMCDELQSRIGTSIEIAENLLSSSVAKLTSA